MIERLKQKSGNPYKQDSPYFLRYRVIFMPTVSDTVPAVSDTVPVAVIVNAVVSPELGADGAVKPISHTFTSLPSEMD